MIEGIFSQYGLAGIFGTLLVVSVLTERLIPRRTHLRFCQMYEAANAQLRATLVERERQIAILLGHPVPTQDAGVVSSGYSG